ncbi:MAG: TMEM175 family protein [Halobacteriota archaeon]
MEDSLDGLSHYDLRALDRLIFFSDAVFAIAITLLVLNITVPIIAPGAEGTELSSALLATVPKLFSYALSFLVIGAYWMAHHRTFHYVIRYDRGLAWRNLLFLLFIGLIPFPTGVVGTYGDQLAAALLYAAVLTITGLLMALLWYHISHNHRLLPKTVTTQFIRASTWRSLSSPIVFLASMAVAFVSVPAAESMWFLVFVINAALERRTRAA